MNYETWMTQYYLPNAKTAKIPECVERMWAAKESQKAAILRAVEIIDNCNNYSILNKWRNTKEAIASHLIIAIINRIINPKARYINSHCAVMPGRAKEMRKK